MVSGRFGFRTNMPSMRSVTMKPPTMLIVPKAIAITPITLSRALSESPMTISPPSMTMPWIALVWLISGVCSVVGTFEISSNPRKAARAKMMISVTRSISWIALLRLRRARTRSGGLGGFCISRGALVADLALVGEAGSGDHLVVEVQRQRALLVDQQAEQVLDVLGVELRGVGGHVARQVDRRDHLDPVVGDDRLARLGQLAVAARIAGEVDDDRARGSCSRRPAW